MSTGRTVPRVIGLIAVPVLLAGLGGVAPAAARTVKASQRAASVTAAANWATQPPSGVKRQEVTYTALNGKLYLAGGKSTLHQAYDPATRTWSTVAPLPVALDHMQVAALNGLIYYVGGLTGYPKGTSSGSVYVYDPVANSFSTAAPLPLGRDRGAGGIATYQGRLYLAGGFHTGATVRWFDSYDPVTNTWTALPDLPEPRDHVSAAVVNGRFYVIGGRTYGPGLRGENDAFNFASGTWTTGLAPLPTRRAGAATAVFGAEIAVIGGEGGGATFSTNQAYNTTTNTWRSLPNMPTARHGIQAAMDQGTAYIADGGLTQGGGNPTDIQESFTLGEAPLQPDCRVRLLSETPLTGNNVYGTDGTGQTRAGTVARGGTLTYVFSVQNDGPVADSLRVQSPGGQPNFAVRYLAGTTGTTDITSQVVSGAYQASLAAAGVRAIRLEVTSSSAAPAGSTGTWLAVVTSNTSGLRDACAAQLTTSS